MSLKEYGRKRDFARTPEPGPQSGAGRKQAPRFVIHRHDATRLHFDLRLEHGGVLKSWAVPKGLPTPHDARKLAVSVEDHPLEYLAFSGRIPEGEYGAGKVEIWDTGTWIPKDDPDTGLKKGKLTFELEGGKVRGEFTLARMNDDDWLIILAKTRELNPDLGAAGKAAPMPRAVAPMLAVLAESAFSSPDYLYEIKFDGMRAISYLDADGRLSIMSRNQKEQAFRYPELGDLAAHFLAAELVVDGEIVAMDEQGVSRFQLLQGRLNLSGATDIERASATTPAFYYVFDILYLNGRDLSGMPLVERKAVLSRIFLPQKHIRLSEWVEEAGEAMFAFARERDLEGVVAKRRTAPYRQKRSRDWLKFKAVREQEFVIGGFTRPRRSRAYFGALLLGLYEGEDLVYAGHVGTGFSEESLRQLHEIMEPLVQEEPPFKEPPQPNEPASWLRPELVAEVKFAEWTREGLLRQPVFLGLRFDISPRDCVREEKKEAAPRSGAQDSGAGEAGAPAAAAVLKDLPISRKGDQRLAAGAREILLTNLDKVFWPQEGYTKFDLVNYYHRVSLFLVPHLAGRPLTLKRYPDGTGKEPFFQKEAPAEAPAWAHTEVIPSESGGKRDRIRYLVCDDAATLLYLANLACISQNPWLSSLPHLEQPDVIAFDLDPVDPDDFEACVEAALLVRDKLGGFGLRGYPKTSGATGMHVYVPVQPRYSFAQTRKFAEIIAALCLKDRPDLITLEQPVSKRAGARLYLDFLQNVKGKTLASVYSVRARPGAPVSTPLSWTEVRRGLSPSDFTMLNTPARLESQGDLFAGVLTDHQDLLAALEQGGKYIQAV